MASTREDRMRIAVVEPAPYGGLLHYGFQLADGLAAAGHEVDLIVARGNELASHPLRACQRAILPRIIERTAPPPRTAAGRLVRRGRIAWRLVRVWVRITAVASARRYDVVLLTGDYSVLPAAVGVAALALRPGRPPLAAVLHNAEVPNRSRAGGLVARRSLSSRLMDFTVRRFSLAFVHGDRLRSQVAAAYPDLRLAVIPHGDERIFAADPPAPSSEERILLFGTWNRLKGIEMLTEAFDLLSERRPNARLTIAGEPASREVDVEAIRRWAASQDGRVEVIDRYVPLEEVRAVFARARIVVTPYVLGSQSGVIHLAMTMGRAVVTTDVGELGRAVVDGETGFVVPPRDPRALADALERLVADPALAARFGDEARRRAFDESAWERVAERVAQQLDLLRA